MKKWEGAKTCNLGVWKNDYLLINGHDESYVGWGREDSDLVVRLINSKIYRKEAIFSTGLMHLYHKINSRENFSRNDKLLNEAILKNKTYINNGYEKNESI
jgi:predicted glycosyltransferase involved in capsule biosynthesis